MSTAGLEHRAAGLAVQAAQLAERSERERRLPPKLSAELAAAGLYRLCVPATLGGAEAEPAQLLRIVEALAAGDAAAGWCVAVCATAGLLAGYVAEDAAREVFGDADAVVGGVFAPMGRAVAGERGFTVSGRWRFASNVENCRWLMGGCVVLDGEEPRMLPGGRPDVRLMLFEADEAEVIDTWSVSGLRGTGSHDFAVDGLEVPLARSASLISDRPRASGPLYAFPPFGLLAVSIGAVALGIARGALDDLTAIAGAKTPTLSTRRLGERPLTQARLAQAEGSVGAARALLFESVERAWELSGEHGAIGLEPRARLRLAASHAVEASAAAVTDAYHLAGGSALYDASPLQRRLRDVHAATQHMLVAAPTWELAGRVLLGLDVDDAQL